MTWVWDDPPQQRFSSFGPLWIFLAQTVWPYDKPHCNWHIYYVIPSVFAVDLRHVYTLISGVRKYSRVSSMQFMSNVHGARPVVAYGVVKYHMRNVTSAFSSGAPQQRADHSDCLIVCTNLCSTIAGRVMGRSGNVFNWYRKCLKYPPYKTGCHYWTPTVTGGHSLWKSHVMQQ